MSLKKWLLISCLALLSACTPQSDENTVILGTISGPETELVEVAQKVASEKHNLTIKIVEFDDYNIPNSALNEGSLDANLFQHQPFLDLSIAYRDYDLVSIGKLYVYPMGMYSEKHESLADLPEGATIGLPIDPSNEARALRLLAEHGLIEIPDLDDIQLTTDKIINNPQNFNFLEMDAAQLPRSLDEVDAAVINTTFAIPANLIPSEDALILESKDSPYANVIVVRTQTANDPKFQRLIAALQSDEVQQKAVELFKGQAIQAWEP